MDLPPTVCPCRSSGSRQSTTARAAVDPLERQSTATRAAVDCFGGGESTRPGWGGGIVRPPKSRFFKTDQTPLELGKGKGNGLGEGQAHGPGLGCLVFNFYSRRRAKRGGGYLLDLIDQLINLFSLYLFTLFVYFIHLFYLF